MINKDKRIGYWWSRWEPNLPLVKYSIDNNWDKLERLKIVNYLKQGKVKESWMGFSNCRICNRTNGSTCLTDGVYTWPEGYAHYVTEHNVKPPQEFIDHVNSTNNN